MSTGRRKHPRTYIGGTCTSVAWHGHVSKTDFPTDSTAVGGARKRQDTSQRWGTCQCLATKRIPFTFHPLSTFQETTNLTNVSPAASKPALLLPPVPLRHHRAPRTPYPPPYLRTTHARPPARHTRPSSPPPLSPPTTHHLYLYHHTQQTLTTYIPPTTTPPRSCVLT